MARWTEAEKELLFAMRAEGKTWDEVGDAMDRDRETCRTWYRDWTRRCEKQERPQPKRNTQMFGPPRPPGCFLYVRAVRRMFERQARDAHVPMFEIIQKNLGIEPRPKSTDLRHIHKTSSMQRRVNAVFQLSEAA